MNSNQLGDAALGKAISYFTGLGYTVCIPLTDSQKYDLVIDNGQALKKVQVRSTRVLESSGNYSIGLRTLSSRVKGPDRIKKFDPNSYDLLFVVTPNSCHLINTQDIKTKTYLTMDSRYPAVV